MNKSICVVIGCLLMTGCLTPNLTIKDHRASFLFDNAGTRVMNILAHNISDSQFEGTLNRCIGNGDKLVYLFTAYNKGDGPGTTSFYIDDKFNGTIDNNKVKLMQKRMKKIKDKKLSIVAWMFADDNTRNVNFKDTAALKNCLKTAINKFDSYISEYVVALEADEYLSSGQVEELAAYIKKETGKPVGSHQVPGKYNYSANKSIDKHYHQYGFNKSNSYIEKQTKLIKAALNKPVVAAEYDMSSDSAGAKSRGDAAMKGGASGTGNGRN